MCHFHNIHVLFFHLFVFTVFISHQMCGWVSSGRMHIRRRLERNETWRLWCLIMLTESYLSEPITRFHHSRLVRLNSLETEALRDPRLHAINILYRRSCGAKKTPMWAISSNKWLDEAQWIGRDESFCFSLLSSMWPVMRRTQLGFHLDLILFKWRKNVAGADLWIQLD